MTDERPNPRVSNRMSPLAWLIIAIVIILGIVAFVQWRGAQHTPRANVAVPLQQGAGPAVMPQQPNVPNAPQPASTANGNEAAEANPSPNEPGGPENTGNAAGSGGANTTGAAPRYPT